MKHEFEGGGRLLAVSGVIGVAGLLLWGFGVGIAPRQAFASYLVAFAVVVSTQLGALIFLMTGHVMNARWVVLVRRITETIAATLPLSALLFIPLALGAGELYPWVGEASPEIEHKRAYLNLGGFIVRAAFFFVAWSIIALLLRRWSIAGDRAGSSRPRPVRVLSALGLPLVALTMTFASFDWLMSLDPAWFSAVFGIYVFSGGFLACFALLIVVTAAAERAGHLAGLVRPSHYHALGRLLLSFVIFWAYIAYFQYFLIAIADKPEEVTFFVTRSRGGWRAVEWVLILGHFAVPFLVLLSRDVKLRAAPLAVIAAWLLAMHVVDVYWLVLPAVHPEGAAPHWLDLAALCGVVGLVVAFGTWLLRGRPIVPLHDPAFDDALRYRSL